MPKLRARFAGAVLLILAVFTAVPAVSDPLRVVYTEWFPYTFTDNGQPTGFEIEVARAVFERLTVEAEFVQYPWRRCLAYLESGYADALVSLLKTSGREVFTDFPEEHISVSHTSFFAQAGRVPEYKGDFEQLKGLRVGVVMGFSYGGDFDKASGFLKDETADAKGLIQKVLAGRVDLAAENQTVVAAEAARMGVADKIRFLSPSIHTQKLYVGFTRARNMRKLVGLFSDELKAFKESQQYRDILARYGIPLSMQ